MMKNTQIWEKMNLRKLLDLNSEEARRHFLKGSSYFNEDFLDYTSSNRSFQKWLAFGRVAILTDIMRPNPMIRLGRTTAL